MKPYLALAVTVPALLIAASGTAAVTRGWVLPMNRRHIRNPRLYGWGQLLTAFALCWQVFAGLGIDDPGTRLWGTLAGGALLVAGLVVMVAGQFSGRLRQPGGAAR
ncbi:hypothetical protein ACIP46_03775 [Streptomyces lavendulae]|uniref:hypothetical protein n=1 Tax=Streptomyces lavendulae TaxID=1914 RepID=UPI0033296859